MPANNELWVPPLFSKDQQRVNRQRKRLLRKWLTWTGFRDKTLWDLLQLLAILAIPVIIAAGTLWFSNVQSQVAAATSDQQHKTDLSIAEDQQQEAALQMYLDRMSDLLLNDHLSISHPGDEVRQVSRARTLTIFPQIDGNRKRKVIQFLYEAGLIQGTANMISIIDLSGANLRGVDLSGSYLSGADLSMSDLSGSHLSGVDLSGTYLSGTNITRASLVGANLAGANLVGANLYQTSLSEANLSKANLIGANLSGANLSRANLSGANLYSANLSGANLSRANLSGAIMPNGTIHS